jgi:hypothetical protein
MKKIGLTMAMAALAGAMNLAQAEEAAPAAAPAPAAGVVVFGFEDDAWKAAKFSAENGVLTVEAANATEGTKALALAFDRAGKAAEDRPTIRINKVTAFAGAKKVLVDIHFVGQVDPKTKVRIAFKDDAKAAASTEETLTEGKATIEISMATCDANKLNNAKICLDNCTSGKGVLYVDNIRVVR